MRTACLGCASRQHHELTVQTSTPTYRTVTHTLSYPFHQHVHHVSVSVALQTLSEPPRDHPPTHSLVQSHEQTQSSTSSTEQLVYVNAFHGLHRIRRRPSLDTIHKLRLVTPDRTTWASSRPLGANLNAATQSWLAPTVRASRHSCTRAAQRHTGVPWIIACAVEGVSHPVSAVKVLPPVSTDLAGIPA